MLGTVGHFQSRQLWEVRGFLQEACEVALNLHADSCWRPLHVSAHISLTPGQGSRDVLWHTSWLAHCAVSSPVQSTSVGRLPIHGSNQPLAESWLGALISSPGAFES